MKKIIALTACLTAALSLTSCEPAKPLLFFHTDYTHHTFKGALKNDQPIIDTSTTTYWGYSGDDSVKETQKGINKYECIIYYQADNPKVAHMTGAVHFIGQTRFKTRMTINQCIEKYKKIKNASNFEGDLYWDALIELPKSE